MPFKSKAQARAMFAKADRGEISKATVKEWASKTNWKKLPEKKKAKKSK